MPLLRGEVRVFARTLPLTVRAHFTLNRSRALNPNQQLAYWCLPNSFRSIRLLTNTSR